MSDIKEVQSYFKNIGRRIKSNSETTLREVGELGFNMAQELVPHEKGFTREGIINFPQDNETWIIQSSPPRDEPDFALNVFLDEGTLGALNWGSRNAPKTGEFGFMQKTNDFLEKEFLKRMNVSITRSLK